MRKYLVYTRLSIQNTFAYRGPMLVWVISNLLTIFTWIAVWLSADSSGLIGGFTKSGLITYYVFSLLMRWLTDWFPFYWLKYDIANGKIVGDMLTKPVSAYWQVFCNELGWHIVSFNVGIFSTLLVAIPFSSLLEINFSPSQIFLSLLSTILAIFVVFNYSMCQSTLAFWFTNINAVDSIHWIGRVLLGGQGLPFTFLSGTLSFLAIFLPFRYMFSLPLEILFGQLNQPVIFQGILFQTIWSLVLYLIFKIMWHYGQKSYSAFGN